MNLQHQPQILTNYCSLQLFISIALAYSVTLIFAYTFYSKKYRELLTQHIHLHMDDNVCPLLISRYTQHRYFNHTVSHLQQNDFLSTHMKIDLSHTEFNLSRTKILLHPYIGLNACMQYVECTRHCCRSLKRDG